MKRSILRHITLPVGGIGMVLAFSLLTGQDSCTTADSDGDGYDSCEPGQDPMGNPPCDCDDDLDTVYPGATELCDDGVDQDCDGEDLTGCQPDLVIDLSTAAATFLGEASYDYAGSAVAGVGDVNRDGAYDLLIGAQGHTERDQYAGAAYLIHGPASGTTDLSQADARFLGEDLDDRAGISVVGAGDLNGDGFDDIAIGAYQNDTSGSDAGAVYVFYGPLAGDYAANDADARLLGERAGDEAGRALDGGRDVTGDGVPDILVGGRYNGTGDVGAAYVVAGPIRGDLSLTDAFAKLIGEYPDDRAGSHVAFAGDIDGDGAEDLLIGAPGNDEGEDGAGAAYLVRGPVSGEVALATAAAKFVGIGISDVAGGTVAAGGDINGDGFGDLIVSAIGNDTGGSNAGAVYLFYGPVWGTMTVADADAIFYGESGNDLAGHRVSSADINQDGLSDVLISAPYDAAGGDDAGCVYINYGPLLGTMDLAFSDVQLTGESSFDLAGISLGIVPDAFGSGNPGILVGADTQDTSGLYTNGVVYLVNAHGF